MAYDMDKTERRESGKSHPHDNDLLQMRSFNVGWLMWHWIDENVTW